MRSALKILCVIFLLLNTLPVKSQVVNYTIAKESKMLVEGTSNVRDWGVDVDEIKGTVAMDEKVIEMVEFSILTETFKGHINGMNKHIQKAIKQKEYPELTFKLDQVESFDGTNAVIKGNLTIAGTSQLVIVEGQVEKKGEEFEITGEKMLKMSDFDIEPPKAVLGTVKAADEIKVTFEIMLAAESN